MPAPRKKRVIREQPVPVTIADVVASTPEGERGALIHRFALNIKRNGPIVIDDPNSRQTAVVDEDNDPFELFEPVMPIRQNTIINPTTMLKQAPTKRAHRPVVVGGPSLLLGADPEFVVVNKSGRLEDCKSLDRHLEHGGIGYDHSGRCAEFRPNPGSPKELIENIRQLMVHVRDSRPGRTLVAGGCSEFDMACGGHIHFNIQRYHLTHVQDDEPDGEDQTLIHALDSFLGRKMLRMEGAKRSKPNATPYGFHGDWREQPHGFEYRTPPSFIGDPVFAESVFAVAHRVAKVWLDNPNAFIEMKGRMAKRKEYGMLIPTQAECPKTEERDYWRSQISTFIRMAWDDGFKLNNHDMIEKWTAGIPVKVLWRTVNLEFPEDMHGMSLVGSFTVASDFNQNLQSVRVVAMPEWCNLRDENIMFSKSMHDMFRLTAKRRDLERHGIAFLASEGTDNTIGIPQCMWRQGSRYTHRCLERFFQAMGLEFDLHTV